jgi:hypothetical protein
MPLQRVVISGIGIAGPKRTGGYVFDFWGLGHQRDDVVDCDFGSTTSAFQINRAGSRQIIAVPRPDFFLPPFTDADLPHATPRLATCGSSRSAAAHIIALTNVRDRVTTLEHLQSHDTGASGAG